MPTTPTISMTTVGPSQWIKINLNAFRNGVGLIANLSTGGTANFDLQVTGQDSNLPNFGTVVNGMDNMVGLTGSKNNSLAYPCTAIRINVNSITPGTIVSLSVIQAVD